VNHCVNDISSRAPSRCSFSTTSPRRLVAGGCGADRCRRGPRLPRERLRAARRENRGDARFYADGEYDIAGFIVGIVERARVIDGRDFQPGDVLIGSRLPAFTPTVIRLRDACCSMSRVCRTDTLVDAWGRRSGRRCWHRTGRTSRPCVRCSIAA
jgi:hypothetical protein